MRQPKLTADKPWVVLRNPHGDQKLIGYARVSTREQNLDAQLLRLREAKCCRIYAEKVSGASGPRPGWNALLEELRAEDVLLVLRIDRMGRKLHELVRSLDTIRRSGAHVRSIEEQIDTSQKGGKFGFNMVAVFAEKVRDDIADNTRAGLAAAKLRGAKLGRPSNLGPAKLAQLTHLRAQGFSLRAIGAATNLGKTTVARGLELADLLRNEPRQMTLTGTEAP